MKEPVQTKELHSKKAYQIFLIIGVVLIAFNLRPAITSVGPLIGIIRDDVGFQNWSVALLTGLPLIAFAIMSPMAPKIANRLTNEWTLFIGLFMLMIGIGLRSISIVFFLFFGTLLIGLGIAICNVLLPGVIKEKFPHKVAIMTSIYTTGMGIFATTASGVSIPIAEDAGLGWQVALLIWMIPVVIGLFIWFYLAQKNKKLDQFTYLDKQQSKGMWRSSLAWHIALFMGLQSLIFYVSISWLAEILIDFGMTQTMAGFMVSYFQLLGIPVSFIMPILAVKLKSQSIIVFTVNLFFVVGILMLIGQPTFRLTLISVALIGIASSANFALALTFLSIRAKNPKDAAALSGMAQSIGYILAALGPIMIGSIYDITQGWTIPLYLLILITIFIIYFGIRAGQNKYVLEEGDGHG